MKAKLIAVTSPGGERHPYADVTFDVVKQTCTMTIGVRIDRSVEYFDLVLPDGKQVVSLPPGGDLLYLVDEVMSAKVLATFSPQAWQRDCAIPVDGEVSFNVLPKLVDMDHNALMKLVDERGARDELAGGLAEAEAHSGPFEVEFDESDVVRMACLFSGMHGALGETDSISDIPERMWDDACAAARVILGRHKAEMQSATPPQNWEDWFERFKPKGADPEEDEAYLLRDLQDPEVLRVIQEDPSRVWTSLDVDGVESIASGVHFVNRMGYYLCEVPYSGPPCDVQDQDPLAEPQTWDELVDRFEPLPLPVARDPGNLLRSASDAELRQLAETEPARIWTILDVGGAETIVNGFQETPGAAYILCKVPYCGPSCEIAGDSSGVDVPRQRG